MYMEHAIKILVTCMHDDIFYEALTLVTQAMKNVSLDTKSHLADYNVFVYCRILCQGHFKWLLFIKLIYLCARDVYTGDINVKVLSQVLKQVLGKSKYIHVYDQSRTKILHILLHSFKMLSIIQCIARELCAYSATCDI